MAGSPNPPQESQDGQPSLDGQRDPRAGNGCRSTRRCRTPGCTDGHGRDGSRAVGRPSALQPRQPALVRPRPLHPVERPCLDAAIRGAAPDRLCAVDRGHQAVPPAAQQDARPSGARDDAGHRDHHRSARPGHHQRGRLRAGREAARGRVQPQGPLDRRPPHLRLPGRRLHDGRHQPRSRRPGRRLEAQQADRAVRQQRHLDRRRGQELADRRSARTLRRPWLERHRPDRRQRRQGRVQGDRQGQEERRQADPHHLQDRHRQGQPEPRRHRQGARRGARREGDRAHSRSHPLALSGLRDPARGLRRLGPHRRRRQGRSRLEREVRRLFAGLPGSGRRVHPPHEGRAAEELPPGRLRHRDRGPHQGRERRQPQGQPAGAGALHRRPARDARRQRRPDRLEPHQHQEHPGPALRRRSPAR